MFKKILIANRGEIACRIIESARKLGIQTVAVYSDVDRDSRHTELADEAVCIGPGPSAQSYLLIEQIISACKKTGAQAVHPGYGFLSENAEFARVLENQGIIFIGPKHEAISAMGDKITSKKLAESAGVNVIPGCNDIVDTQEKAIQIAQEIGYPVMVKASAGGGGKGLRVAHNDAQVKEAFISCQNEARASFGDDRLFIEKYIENPRHIEIQILGDAHGNIVHLYERECSVQRRHQKVIEEAPSPFLNPATRKKMGEQAIALARAVNYQSAGTVEFVVGSDQSFYFLEMNTRLQVEHPVTECITGLDLVELMIRVAAGEPLELNDIPLKGWAMECRINAEDASRGFLPSTGRLTKFTPPTGEGIRVDTGVYEGGEIPIYYDSMIAKLIVHASDRSKAIEKMRDALNSFVIRGVNSTVPFQSALMHCPQFESGQFDTGLIQKIYPDGFNAHMVKHDNPDLLALVAAFIHRRFIDRASSIEGQMVGYERLVSNNWVVKRLDLDEPLNYAMQVMPIEGGYTIEYASKLIQLYSPWCLGDDLFNGVYNEDNEEKSFTMQVIRHRTKYSLIHDGVCAQFMVLSARSAQLQALMPEKIPPDLSRFLFSPMPGLLRELYVEEGQEVQPGQKVAVIEAMKMENVIKAEKHSKVKRISVRPGESLVVDQEMIEFE